MGVCLCSWLAGYVPLKFHFISKKGHVFGKNVVKKVLEKILLESKKGRSTFVATVPLVSINDF